MNFHFRHDDPHAIEHNDTDACAGYVKPLKGGTGFSVHWALTSPIRDRIATIGDLNEAIPVLTAYYEAHPPRWKRKRVTRFYISFGDITFTAYVKWAFYGVLSVERQEPGVWVANRCTEPLLHDGREAIFATSE